LTGRNQKVVIGGDESSTKGTNAGVPQGSILGPLLFLIFINDIVDELENPMFLFADDATLMTFFKDIDVACASINRDLDRLSRWAEIWRVTFNLLKTVFMILSKKLHIHRPRIIMNNTELKQVDEECYLGLILNSNISWKPHISKITCKASKKLGLLYKMRNKISRSALSKYYISFIRPVLEYGSVVFDNCTIFYAHSLEQVQRRAARFCTGAFKRAS
jgi:ribonuclease P/MRP protein subunit RPP40